MLSRVVLGIGGVGAVGAVVATQLPESKKGETHVFLMRPFCDFFEILRLRRLITKSFAASSNNRIVSSTFANGPMAATLFASCFLWHYVVSYANTNFTSRLSFARRQ